MGNTKWVTHGLGGCKGVRRCRRDLVTVDDVVAVSLGEHEVVGQRHAELGQDAVTLLVGTIKKIAEAVDSGDVLWFDLSYVSRCPAVDPHQRHG